jgi:hypothetical protein
MWSDAIHYTPASKAIGCKTTLAREISYRDSSASFCDSEPYISRRNEIMHQQPNMKMDKNSLTTGDRFYMSHSPIPQIARRTRVGLGYELLNDYAEHDDGNLSNRSATDLSGHGPVLPGLSIKTFHSNLLFSGGVKHRGHQLNISHGSPCPQKYV